MKRIRLPLFLLGLSALLAAGCITVSEHRLTLDTGSGEVVREYVNLTSRQGGGDEKYSVTNDWAALKKMVAERPDETNVVAFVSRTLFETNGVLCGRERLRVRCPECFPSPAAVLDHLQDDKDWRFEMLNDEVVAYLPKEKKVLSTNGRSINTPNNAMIFWPSETNRFEYTVSEATAGGESLLPFFRAEQAQEK